MAPKALLNEKNLKKGGIFMGKHRGKKRNNYISARDKIMHNLNELFVPGTKKIEAERYQIRSYKSLENYKAIANRFIDFCEKESIKTVSAMENMIPEYLLLKKEEGCSNATYKTYRTGLCRAFSLTYEEVQRNVDLLSGSKFDFTLRRQDLKRSRDYYYGNRVNDTKEGSLAHEIKIVCEATGLRRRELESVCPQHFFYDEKDKKHKIYLTASKEAREKTGFQRVNTKGGRDRVLEILDNKEALNIIKKWCENKQPDEPLMKDKNISRNQDIHSYRATYANRIYVKYARPVDEIEERNRIPSQRKNKSQDGLVSPIIRLQGDLLGIALDRNACRTVSNFLGHEREEIFQNSYLRKDQIPTEMVTL